MARFYPHTLRTRLLLAFALMQVLAVSLLGTYMISHAARSELATQQKLARNMMALAEPTVLRMLAMPHSQNLKIYLENLIENTAIARVFVSNRTGTLIYQLGHEPEAPNLFARLFGDESGGKAKLFSELEISGVSQGMFEIKLSNRNLNQRLTTIVANHLLMLLGLLTVTLGLTWWLISGFTLPLKQLVDIAAGLGRGGSRLNIEAPDSSYDEIRELGAALTQGAALMGRHIQDLETTQSKLKSSETQLRSLVNNMREALFELDDQGHICFLNPAWHQITGLPTSKAFGRSFHEFLISSEDAELFQAHHLAELDLVNHETELRRGRDASLWVELDAHATFDEHGHLTGVVGRFQNISQRIELARSLERHQQELYEHSITDELTGLRNRRHFDSALSEILPRAMAEERQVSIALFDIDGFKFINDTYGHIVGDKVLRTVADLLNKMVRPRDIVARLAGDEFAVIFQNTGVEEAQAQAESLLHAITATRVAITVGHLSLQASVGISVAPTHGETAQDLLGAADVALYHAKRRRAGSVEVLSTDISQGIMEVFNRGFELRRALENGDFLPTFQPITDLRTGKPIAYEVLCVMRLGEVLVPAGSFIKVAEDLGLVREIDLHIIGTAFTVAPREVELFLNISLMSFNHPNFGDDLLKLIRPAREAGRPITIEITERTTVPLSDGLLDQLNHLRELGCKLALDDFGHGYSTYSYLRRFKPEYLKIDGSYVEGVVKNKADHMIVEHIHELTKSFGAISIAESMENQELRQAVMRMGIHCGQGYMYGKPATADKVFGSRLAIIEDFDAYRMP